jgi:hypothetical protein
MNRWILAVAALVGLVACPVFANKKTGSPAKKKSRPPAKTSGTGFYFEIILDLNKHAKFKEQVKQGGNAAGMSGARGMTGAAGFGGQTGAFGNAGAAGFGGMSGAIPTGGAVFGGGSGSGSMPMGFNGMAGGMRGDNKSSEPKKLVRVIVEVPAAGGGVAGKLMYLVFRHKWGVTTIPFSDMAWIQTPIKKLPTVKRRFEQKRRQYYDKDGKATKGDLTLLAAWALKHGLVDEFPKIMDDLADVNPKHPALTAYKQVAAAMKANVSIDEPSSNWLKNRLPRYEPKHRGHFTLLTNNGNAEDIDRRFQLLEDTYKTFFYWFALKGKALQVPRYRLVDVLVADRGEYKNQALIFKSVPKVVDGFTAPRDNVSVFSSNPLDPLYMQLEDQNSKIFGETDPKKYLPRSMKALPNIDDANKQVFALVQKAMQEEMERTTVTHQVVRQLLAAAALPAQSGMSARIPVVSRNLASPEWLRFGLASFFETSRGAYWPGGIGPNWNYYIQFNLAKEAKKISRENIKDVLEKVITDQYFLDAAGGTDQAKTEFARTTAWALVFYLASDQNFDKFMVYLQKLGNLPRHMKVDKAILRKVFEEAFGADLGNFAGKWYSYINDTTIDDIPNLVKEAKALRKLVEESEQTTGKDKGTGTGTGGGYRPPTGPPDGFRPPVKPPETVKPPEGFRPPQREKD